jgi:hypothetical protein
MREAFGCWKAGRQESLDADTPVTSCIAVAGGYLRVLPWRRPDEWINFVTANELKEQTENMAGLIKSTFSSVDIVSKNTAFFFCCSLRPCVSAREQSFKQF